MPNGSSIRRDRSEALYDLEKYDDEISQMEQDLEETAKKKKDADRVVALYGDAEDRYW